jgi:hypothetical protein
MAVHAELATRALEKLRRGAPYSIAAVLVAEATPNGLDGARWHMYVTDGRESGVVDVDISGTNGGHRGMEIAPAFLEAEVEFLSGSFPRDERLRLLLAASPVAITADRLPAPA